MPTRSASASGIPPSAGMNLTTTPTSSPVRGNLDDVEGWGEHRGGGVVAWRGPHRAGRDEQLVYDAS